MKKPISCANRSCASGPERASKVSSIAWLPGRGVMFSPPLSRPGAGRDSPVSFGVPVVLARRGGVRRAVADGSGYDGYNRVNAHKEVQLVSKGFVEAEYESGEAGAEGMRLDREGQAEAFDAIGDRYDEAFPYKKGQLAAAEWLIRSLAGGARVLDLGCGTGLPTARQLVDAGFEVVGVDLSRRMVELAREYVPGATFQRLDIADLGPDGPHDPGRFDAVAAFFSLLMLPRGDPRRAAEGPRPAGTRWSFHALDGGGRRGLLHDPVPR